MKRRGPLLITVLALLSAAAIAGGAVTVANAFRSPVESTVIDTVPVVGPSSDAVQGSTTVDPSAVPGTADPAAVDGGSPSPSPTTAPVPVAPAPAAPTDDHGGGDDDPPGDDNGGDDNGGDDSGGDDSGGDDSGHGSDDD